MSTDEPAVQRRTATSDSRGSRMYFGQAGHFIGAKRCRFHIHTHARGFCVSTVGEWFPKAGARDVDGDAIGVAMSSAPESFYETMIFELDADGDHNARPLMATTYPTRDLANAGHEIAVRYAESGQLAGDQLFGGLPVPLCDRLHNRSSAEAVFRCARLAHHDGECAPGRRKAGS